MSIKTPFRRTRGSSDAAALIVLILVVALILYPFALIWAINTLFGLSIAFTFQTWLASLLVLCPLVVKVGGSS